MYSRGLTLANVTVTNQAFWAVHPYACDDVYIGNVNITAPRDEGIANDDGIDPDSTSNVLVENCWVSVGPSTTYDNVLVENCCVSVGPSTTYDNVLVENCCVSVGPSVGPSTTYDSIAKVKGFQNGAQRTRYTAPRGDGNNRDLRCVLHPILPRGCWVQNTSG